jgi:hypothetical protein
MAKAEEPEVKEKNGLNPKHQIRDTIHISLALAEYTKIPILLLGDPGCAKTSNIRSWAAMKNYEVVTLIGSQRTAEEVLGYLVNSGTRLETFTPDWFDEIWEYKKAGKKTVLFIDELSTAPENVQGAMLQLIFDRKVGGRNFLPDDTLIVSAANYKGNLPPQNRLMAPTLNRFILVNIAPTDGKAYIDEFLQDPEDWNNELIEFGNIEITPQIKKTCRQNLTNMWENIFSTYSTEDGTNAVLDVQNHDLDEIYDQPGKVYNFISGRTVSYLYDVALGLVHLGVCRRMYADKISNIVLGLVGNGTNTFKSPQDAKDFRSGLVLAFQKVLRLTLKNSTLVENATRLDFNNMNVNEAITQWILYMNGSEVSFDDNFKDLIGKIKSEYDPTVSSMGKKLGTLKDENAMTTFVNDMSKIDHLAALLESTNLTEIAESRTTINTIKTAYEGYSAMVRQDVLGA